MALWQHRTVIRDGINLAARHGGNPAGPTVVLVHGYPDNSDIWDQVAGHLADHCHLVVYDVRGAGASSAPRGLAAYRLTELSADLFAVIDAFSPERPVHLVGHDWGSIQCWEAVTEPGAERRIASWTSLSGPCLDHIGQDLRRRRTGDLADNLRQALKSWYIAAFHLPLLAPAAWRLGLAGAWPALLRRTERLDPPVNPTQRQDGAQGVALYRANMLPRLLRPGQRRARMPVQQIVALRDRYVGPALAATAEPWVDALWRREMDTGHWGPLLARPEVTAGYLQDFIAQVEGTSASDTLQRARVAGNDTARP